MVPAVDISRLEPVVDWGGGALRVFRDPRTSEKLEPPEEYAPFGRGYAIPVVGSVTRPDGVSIHFELVGGVPRCVAVEVVEPPDFDEWSPEPTRWLTGAYLRDMAIDALIKQAAQVHAVRLYRRPRGEVVGVHVPAAPTLEDLRAGRLLGPAAHEVGAIADERLRGHRRPGRKEISDETLLKVSAAVREAEAAGLSPIPAVMDLYPQYVASTAKKYINRARQRGFLPAKTKEAHRG